MSRNYLFSISNSKKYRRACLSQQEGSINHLERVPSFQWRASESVRIWPMTMVILISEQMTWPLILTNGTTYRIPPQLMATLMVAATLCWEIRIIMGFKAIWAAFSMMVIDNLIPRSFPCRLLLLLEILEEEMQAKEVWMIVLQVTNQIQETMKMMMILMITKRLPKVNLKKLTKKIKRFNQKRK